MLQNEDKHDKYNVANEKLHTYYLVEDFASNGNVI